MKNNIIILYNSKTGFTQKYARLLAEELDLSLIHI